MASLLAAGAKLTDQVLLINALDEDADGALSVSAKRIGGPLLFDKISDRLGVADVLGDLLKDRAFEFAVERAVFVSTLHRIFASGSDRRQLVDDGGDHHIGIRDLIMQFEVTAGERLEADAIGGIQVAISGKIGSPRGQRANELHAG